MEPERKVSLSVAGGDALRVGHLYGTEMTMCQCGSPRSGEVVTSSPTCVHDGRNTH